MITLEHIATAALLFSGANFVMLLSLAFKWGRWMGTVDTKLAYLERGLNGIEKRKDRPTI